MRQRGGGLVVCCATWQRRQQKSAAASASKQRYGANRSSSPDAGVENTGITAFLTLHGSREKSSAYRYPVWKDRLQNQHRTLRLAPARMLQHLHSQDKT